MELVLDENLFSNQKVGNATFLVDLELQSGCFSIWISFEVTTCEFDMFSDVL